MNNYIITSIGNIEIPGVRSYDITDLESGEIMVTAGGNCRKDINNGSSIVVSLMCSPTDAAKYRKLYNWLKSCAWTSQIVYLDILKGTIQAYVSLKTGFAIENVGRAVMQIDISEV
jgi:hypothetical protein